MSPIRPIEDLFAELIEVKSGEERDAYLDEVCGDDTSLREQLQKLVVAHQQAGSFFGAGEGVETTVDPDREKLVGSIIGPYKLREVIGEGGMGTVYVAEQAKPLRRKVALKVIKPGMDSNAVIARFEAERNALAIMNHPNIAKVLDAGATDQGRPFFAMELVSGIPITDYCDQKKLTVHQRLELFTHVCAAIQHAHQKGVIHRDIKPSNVLVTEQDGKPVAKVIDFGVAKAVGQNLTDRTIYTGFQTVIGTPLYMSPEQAALSNVDVDTRSDVYSLGVLLYELLTGTTPFDQASLQNAAQEEVLRIIREQDPPKPSTKVSTLGERASSVSEGRRTDIAGLGRSIRGDLDWIVMKALEKDRARRYETAVAMAQDVQHYLSNEPIVARSPSWTYRAQKFVNRHRLAVLTSALVFAMLTTTVGITSTMAYRNTMLARQLRVAFFREAITAALVGDEPKAIRAIELLVKTGATAYEVEVLKGTVAYNQGKYEEAIAHADAALQCSAKGGATSDIAASSLRVAASIYAGDEDYAVAHVGALSEMEPVSDVDHLLMANALLIYAPNQSLGLIEKRPSIKYSALGLLIQGRAKVEQANNGHDLELLEDAIRDLRYATFLLRDSPAPLAWYTTAMAEYLEVSRALGIQRNLEFVEESGRESVEKLAAMSRFHHGSFARWLYLRAIGKDVEASSAVRQLGWAPGLALFVAADCLRSGSNGTVDDLKHCVPAENWNDPWVRIARAHLVRDLPNGEQQVKELAEQLVSHSSTYVGRHALSVLCLVKSRDEIRQLATSAPPDFLQLDGEDSLWNGGMCAQLLAGMKDEAEVLADAAGGHYAQCLTHFTIGMFRLAERDRKGALEHFRWCVDTAAVGTFEYELARAYSERMTADPSWPHWLADERGKEPSTGNP